MEIKDYNVVISGQNFFDQPIKNDLRTYGNCLYSKKKPFRLIAIDLCKQQALDTGLKAYQQTNFIGELDQQDIQQCFSLLNKQKKLFWTFHKRLWKFSKFILLQYNIKWLNIAL